MKRVSASVLVVLAMSCGPNRVVLRSVPERTAPLRERQSAFKDLVPESGLETTYYRNGVPVGTSLNWLLLGDGTRVEDPRDLLPAVDDPSPTANYVHSYEKKASAARTWGTVGAVGLVVGAAVMLVPLMVSVFTTNYGIGAPSPDRTPMFVGLAAGGGLEVLSLIPFFVGSAKGSGAQADRVSAFQTYPRALQRRLALEEDGAPPEDAKKKDDPTKVDARTDVPLHVASSPGR